MVDMVSVIREHVDVWGYAAFIQPALRCAASASLFFSGMYKLVFAAELINAFLGRARRS